MDSSDEVIPLHKSADEQTGVPGLRSWRLVYLVVFVNFVVWVALLAIFSRVFA